MEFTELYDSSYIKGTIIGIDLLNSVFHSQDVCPSGKSRKCGKRHQNQVNTQFLTVVFSCLILLLIHMYNESKGKYSICISDFGVAFPLRTALLFQPWEYNLF